MINIQVYPKSIFPYPIGKTFFTPLFDFKARPSITLDELAYFFKGFISAGLVNIGFKN